MLPKEDRKAMLLRLYNEDTPLQDHSKDRFNTGNAKQTIKKEPNDDAAAAAKLEPGVKDETMVIKPEDDEEDMAAAVETAEAEGDGDGGYDAVPDGAIKEEIKEEAEEHDNIIDE